MKVDEAAEDQGLSEEYRACCRAMDDEGRENDEAPYEEGRGNRFSLYGLIFPYVHSDVVEDFQSKESDEETDQA